MEIIALIKAIFIIAVLSNSVLSGSADTDFDVLPTFKNFMIKYKRNYTSTEEHEFRFQIFKQNLKRIAKVNSGPGNGAMFGVNKFADWTDEEFKQLLGNRPDGIRYTTISPELQHTLSNTKAPSSFDWRNDKRKIVGPVRNQGHCGCCWAFSTMETIASAWALAGHAFTELSVQQLLSCDNLDGGCRGGSFYLACSWLTKNKVPLETESANPYLGKKDKCVRHSTNTGIILKKFTATNFIYEESSKMMAAINRNGPLSIAVDATSWRDYVGGIVQHHCKGKTLNHAVQVVGYKLDGPIPYWIVKNSWGEDFGDHGYIYIKMGDNVCGIAETVGWVNF